MPPTPSATAASPSPRTKAGTPRSSRGKTSSRAASAPAKERPRSKLVGAIAATKMSVAMTGSAAPQQRGDPNNIKVGVRCRPLSKTETGMNENVIVQFSGNQICLTNPNPQAGEKTEEVFAYDYMYPMDSHSESVFTDMAQPLVEGLIAGFNATIFAYGQTGSGKTHTMMGSASDPGVTPRVAIDVFERVAALRAELGEGAVVTVRASYIQIYREVLQDLLGNVNEDLKIRRDPKFGTYVQGLSEKVLESAEGLTAVIDQGNKKRAVASTLMNSESSRSHAVVIIRLEQEHPANAALGKGKTKIGSKINLVDLAGSERASKTGATGETLKEAIAINQSLSALGNVINALSDPKAKGHIPYRSSKLTHLLEESLGGNSHTVMLAAISPAGRNFPETFQTLQYASRAKMIVTNAKANAFTEEVKGSAFGAKQLEAMQAEMAAQAAAQQAAQQAALEQQMALMRASTSGDSIKLQAELSEAKAALAAAQAVAEMHTSQLEQERARADEAERQRMAQRDASEMALAHAREEAAEARRRAAEEVAEAQKGATRAAETQQALMFAKLRELEAATAEKERLAVDSLEGQVVRAQMGEEIREKAAEAHAYQLRIAALEERCASLQRELEVARSQTRSIEAQRDQAWAREKLLEEQKGAAEAHARQAAEAKEQTQLQLQEALGAQVGAQAQAQAQASAEHAARMAGSLSQVQEALARLEARHEAQTASASQQGNEKSKAHEEELARLDSLLQAQAAAHQSAIDQLQRRAAAEAERLAEAERRSAEEASQQLEDVQKRLREATEARVRLQSENATRKAAAEALGERVAMLQEQLSSVQLDGEQQRHASIAQKAELEEAKRAEHEELEAARLRVLQHHHEAEGMRQQLRERDESLARRAERLRQLQTLYERTLQEKQRVEEAAWAERQALHEERRALELRVREEAGRARQAEEALARIRGTDTGGGLLSRLFNSGGGTSGGSGGSGGANPPITAKEAWAERPAPLLLTDSARVPTDPSKGGR
jgi:hypothetical protein